MNVLTTNAFIFIRMYNIFNTPGLNTQYSSYGIQLKKKKK